MPGPDPNVEIKRSLPALLRRFRTVGILASLFLLALFFSLTTDSFFSNYNLKTLAAQSVIVSLGAIGMTLVIISGGIDLSVGSVMALSMVVTALRIEAGSALWVAAIAGCLAGAFAGLANGLMITVLRVVPFIGTLGMMGIARGLAKYLADNQAINVDLPSDSWLALLSTIDPSTNPSVPDWLIFAPAAWVLAGLAGAMSLILHGTVFGRHVFAIGSNEAAARLCGVRVRLTQVVIYVLGGLFAGLAGVVFCSRQRQGDPTAALGYELDVIAAVVIGGGSLRGGEGSIAGALIGALIMNVLRTGLRMMNAPSSLQEILIGTIIVVAVVLDQLQHRGTD